MDFLAGRHLGVLATIKRDGRPQLSTVGFASDDGDRTISVSLTAGRAETANDETVEELVELYRTLRGEHPNWDEFRQAMVDEGRLLLRIHVDRVYGIA